MSDSRSGPVQRWRPLGRVLHQPPTAEWSASHAAYPTPLVLADGRVRVFFATRDPANRSNVASVDLSLDGDQWEQVSGVHGPALRPGPRGAFDADGVTLGSMVRHEGRLYGFYLGWTLPKNVPFTNTVGLAMSDDDGLSFERFSPAPILGLTRHNPFVLGYPFVHRLGDRWHMLFGTHAHWGPEGLDMLHIVKEAFSDDLIHWQDEERVVVDVLGDRDPLEWAVSRPGVIQEADGSFSMWFARRYSDYRLGFATSQDGVTWQRADEQLTFLGEPAAWEDRERTYPWVFDHGGERYMLYNGNGYGREGFGLAILERD